MRTLLLLVFWGMAAAPGALAQGPLTERAAAAGLAPEHAAALAALGEAVVVPADPGAFALDTVAVDTTYGAFYLLRYRRPDGACLSLSGGTDGLGGPEYPPTAQSAPIDALPLWPTPAIYWTDATSAPLFREALGTGTVLSDPLDLDGLFVALYSAYTGSCTPVTPADAVAFLATLRPLDPADDRPHGPFQPADLPPSLPAEAATPERLTTALATAFAADGVPPTVEVLRATPQRRVLLVTRSSLADDSVRDERWRVVLRRLPWSGAWTVASGGTQVRCQPGRGPQAWSAERCQ